ncbi:division/cell wall cluster transcriptional repressor MraZ [Salsuginibacillus kocurii]|uniref:division/cell wall cluster transcriptional repressor MraZ n=1 Tax=Salsuginibacillus kocurii TaxID=427078 RepID=UPI0003654DB1|nr:division/cell wall cluster transcriptional repressor MraZ [Salsuginibacillus kocurii]
MFIGEFNHQIDDKGRLILPAKFRDGLGAPFVITRGMDHCLFVYPYEEWKTLEQKVKQLPLTRKDARAFSRFLFSGAAEVKPDKQGRVPIPASLRTYAELSGECVIVGVSTRVEIWSASKWEAYVDEAEMSFSELAENMADLDL